nr:MAG TPA: Transglutaminase elicitor [Caudoviricetes sp.]
MAKNIDIPYVGVMVCGRTSTLVNLEPFPEYIIEGFDDNGFCHCWAAAQIMSILKRYDFKVLLSPYSLKKFILSEIGIQKVDTEYIGKNWELRYRGDTNIEENVNIIHAEVVGPEDCTIIDFEIHINESDEVIHDIIKNLKNIFITNY